ncbi:hypothetical protein PFLmoz3_03938 [Pseudomonas fluorescens]|uniref:Uncharacterized protein n=1 Tax=Pseudomonas fluorescens TaxID=294 RepID=A0A109LFR5_PSEFL|nr:hypothetical protein PFLmoz3_03938 [Pseudomonas fluorescens]
MQVFAEQRHGRDDEAGQQNQRGDRAMAHLLDKAWPRNRRLLGNIQLLVRVASGEALIQHAHIVADGLGHPQHLFTGLLADAVRHLHAVQQLDETTQVNAQGQAQYSYGTHGMASGRSTSTHTNLRGSSWVSWSSRYATSLPYSTAL